MNKITKAPLLTDEQRAQVIHIMDSALLPIQSFADLVEQSQWDIQSPTINPWHFGYVMQALLDQARDAMFTSLHAKPEEAQDELE